jgi:hypothetical protein
VIEANARPLRVIGYCRVSTAKQGDNGYGLGAQHAALEHFCTQHGHLLLTVTSDVVSGAASERMYGREAAIAAIESGLADALLVARSTVRHATRRTPPSCSSAPSATLGDRWTAKRLTAETRASEHLRTYESQSPPRKRGDRQKIPHELMSLRSALRVLQHHDNHRRRHRACYG